MARSARSSAVLIAVAVAIALALMIFFASRDLSRHTCEVCVEFRGQAKCRTAAGSTPEEARRTAVDNACSFLASGMTDIIACTSAPPKSVSCK